MDFNSSSPYPEGVISFLDTDLYKLTMQCAVFKYYADVPVTFKYKNRTPDKRLTRRAFRWLEEQVNKLGNLSLSEDEFRYLQSHCPYLTSEYLDFLRNFRLRPRDQVTLTFHPLTPSAPSADSAQEADDEVGEIDILVAGSWVDTILWEIPILSLTSEAYFKFVDADWDYNGQEERAYEKGKRLLEAGCIYSEFGTRRRRDYHAQALVFRGLRRASEEAQQKGPAAAESGKLVGTSNVHLAMRFGMAPVGTVAHEWFMGIAAVNADYHEANEEALRRWIGCFGEGVLSIALTDTFGTRDFLKAIGRPFRPLDGPGAGRPAPDGRTYAHILQGVRQDSGDPLVFVETMAQFYRSLGITDRKTIVFSDSLNIDRCIQYKAAAEAAGLQPTFGVGTFLTNDFVHKSTGKKSTPLNIVVKINTAMGRAAVKISDNIGKNMGDSDTVERVKQELGYVEADWAEGDETSRWGREGDAVAAP